MKSRFLETKFHIPTWRRGDLSRPRLLERLQTGLDQGRKFTLISAPAGYGKTTLVAEWLNRVGMPFTWLSLDKGDDEPLRFFTYFVVALQRIDENIGKELTHALQAGQLPPLETLVASLVNDIAEVGSHFLYVLDDFQMLQDKVICDGLNGLVAYQPPQLHLVIVTREDPPLPLARLRAKNQMTEIRASDLRFSEMEIGQFLQERMGLSLSPQDIATLENRTEGWVAGLQLAGLSMRGRENPSEFVATLSSSNRFILGYLIDEVLQCQPPEVQNFLLQTSILSKLNGDLCGAVTGQADSDTRLEGLLAANLFLIPLDDEQRWYRYHHLFADLLTNQLRHAHPELPTELHRRASRWYETQAMHTDAIEHAIAASDYARAISLLEEHAWGLLNQGYTRLIETWMQSIPADWHSRSARINLSFAWIHLLRGNFGQVLPYLDQVEAILAILGPKAQETTAIQAEYLALQSNLLQVQGKIAESAESATRALQLADLSNLKVLGLAWLGLGSAYRQAADFDKAANALQNAIQTSRASENSVTEMLAVSHLTLMSIQHGRLRLAAEAASQVMDREVTLQPIAGAVYGALGLVALEWNQMEKAHEHLLRGIKLSAFLGHNASLIYTKVTLARLFQSQSDLESAAKTVGEAVELFQRGAPGWVRPELIHRQVCLALALENPSQAEMILRQSGVSSQDEVSHQTDSIHLAYLRLWMVQHKDKSLDLAQRIVTAAQASQRNGITLQALMLGALLQFDVGEIESSLEWLVRALALAEPEGYIRIFVDEGAPMAALLRHACERGIHPDYACQLLSLFPALEQPPRSSAELIEQLTERELEVLSLLAEGLKYAEIAERLVVSVNTVRYHIKGIYSKLGVDRLAKALEQARQLGLL
ncbi:MAG: LuxR C-terminal-related transcriptional regulator [Anaerolineales bacterium]|nr:LuxR C-terminal-related transcriptional regulator [Anaerolineales bacterium]